MQKRDVYEDFKNAGRNKIGEAFKVGKLTKKQVTVLLARNTTFSIQEIKWTIKGWE